MPTKPTIKRNPAPARRFPPVARGRRGFTLVELIAVLVILAIVAAMGSQFLLSMIDSYNRTQAQTKLINRGRAAIEQMSRQLRNSVPNSLRVEASGDCVEFLPIVAGAWYLSDVPDSDNGAAPTSSINTAPYTLGLGAAVHVVLGALDDSEIYATGSPNGRVGAGVVGAPNTVVGLASAHTFLRNSGSRRLFIADDPLRFCLIGSQLVQYSAYGLLTGALTSADPGGSTTLLAEGVSTSGQAFTLSAGTQDLNAALAIDLNFSAGTNAVRLQQQVLVRNVP